jgi:hypothetical protein
VIVTDEFGCMIRDTVEVGTAQGTMLLPWQMVIENVSIQPANSVIRIGNITDLTEMKASLYYYSNILRCTNFNANEAAFPGKVVERIYMVDEGEC